MIPPSATTDSVEACIHQAELAESRGTFGVGAVLVEDQSGDVLDAVPNDVVRELPTNEQGYGEIIRRTHDPTAHGERRLITRYFERRRRRKQLPPPAQVTIVSSLEPCAMCSGAILASGFKVGIIALDPAAGLGMARGPRFPDLPGLIQEGARNSFGYYEVSGLRPFIGSSRVALGRGGDSRTVSRVFHDACESVFYKSLKQTMAVVSEYGQQPPVADPFYLPEDDPLRSALEERLPHFLVHHLADPREPDERLLKILEGLHFQDPERRSSAALVDCFGNLLAASGGSPTDPSATGFAEVIRSYSRIRFELAGDPVLSPLADRHLAHPKFGTLFRYPVPDPESPVTLFELGAYGSTMEGPLPPENSPNLHFLGRGIDESLSRKQLLGLVDGMPPFYSETVGLDLEVTSL